MKIAIQTVLLPGLDLAEKFANAARYGFDGVEVAIGPSFDLAENMPELEAASTSSGVPVAAICTHSMHDPLLPVEETRREKFKGLTEIMAMAETLGAAGVVSVPVRPPHAFPWFSDRLMMDLAVESFGVWSTSLPMGDAKLFLEPLNRFEATFLRRVDQAAELARRIDHPRVMSLADLFHMNIEESHMGSPLREAGATLGHVHVADNNRYQPGAGCMDFATPLRALADVGYSGYLSLECWQPEGAIILGDPDVALPATISFLRGYGASS